MDDLKVRITVSMPHDLYQALAQIARSECRRPRSQLMYLVKEEANRRGLIAPKTVVHVEHESPTSKKSAKEVS